MRVVPLAVLAALLLTGPAGGATLAGKVRGARKLVTVEAVSLKTGAVAAVGTLHKGRYSMQVPKGPYVVAARNLRRARLSRGVRATRRGLIVALARSSAAGAQTVGIGRIPITVDPAAGARDGQAMGTMIRGLLPECEVKKTKVVDLTPEMQKALEREAKLSKDGQSSLRYEYDPLRPTVVIRGKVTVDADGKPRADIEIVDAATGTVITHIVTGGDPGDIADLAPFLTQLGKGAAELACTKPKVTPTPTPTPTPAPGGEPTARYAGTFDWTQNYDNPDGTFLHTREHYAWDATATASSQSLTVVGNATIHQDSQTAANDFDCTITRHDPLDLQWTVMAGNQPGAISAYVSIPRRVGRQVVVTGNHQNCARFNGNDALTCTGDQCAGSTVCGVAFPPGPKHDAYTEAIAPGRSDVQPETTHHGDTETQTKNCYGGTETVTRSISADLTLSR
ncbi:MAG: hypothetical protein QOI80_2152 [Solirubrobacteraceae bacterium]|nr:hypothetical protein [Solirubrobacteraceae bacterium]